MHEGRHCLYESSCCLYVAGFSACIWQELWQELLPVCKALLPATEKSLGFAYLALWNT